MKFLPSLAPRAILAALLLSLVSILPAQEPEWLQLMQDPNAQFSETMDAFDRYWENRPITKGSGWKPFQRWAYYMESRLAPDGTQSGPLRTLEEFQQYLIEHPNRSRRDQLTTGNWTQVGPAALPTNGTGQPNGMGRTTCLTFHPTDPNTLFVGAPAGGIWKSTDYGASWISLNNGLVRLGVSSIVIHPTNPNTIWIATGDRDGGDAPGYGVWLSTDGGLSWAASNTGMGNRTVTEIQMDPNNDQILIASTTNGIYRSADAGATWTQTLVGANIKDIAYKPGSSTCIYASGTDVYRSLDNGLTWTQMNSGTPVGVQRIALAVTAADPDRVYLFAGDGAGFDGLYLSTDSATNFVTQSTTPNLCGYDVTGGTGSQAWYDLVAVGDPLDADHITTGAINVWESFDAGATWTIVTHWVGSGGVPPVHADDHVLEYSPHTGDIFIGHDGGLHVSNDAGATWSELSSGLAIAQVYKIGQSQQNSTLTINGYQDNGTAFHRNGGWYTEIGGDGMECIVDHNDDNVMYGALYYGDVRRSTNGGASFTSIAANGTNGITESGGWVTPYKLHPTNPDTMFIGYRQVWRSFNCKSAAFNAVTWTAISAFAGTSTIRDLAISESNPDVMYVARNGAAKFYRTSNANAATPAWTDLDAFLPGTATINDIEIHPTDPNTVWIAQGNKIYESNNGGLSWTDISGTLPNISLNTIVYDDLSPVEAMYVGMDVGVYYLDNTLADWELFMNGLPNVEITELEIYYDAECRGKDQLKASTYGRGLWEGDLRDPGTLAPIACFEASDTDACVGEVVTMEDFSAYNPTAYTWTFIPATVTFVNATNANSAAPQVTFDAPGSYTVRLSATNGIGSDLLQKTAYVSVGTAISPPLTEDFEAAALCPTTTDCGATTCALPSGWINLTNGVDDDIDFRVDEAGTPSGGTGPAVDANPGSAAGNYIYLEASSCFGNTAIMESPCILLTGTSVFNFGYHMEGIDMGELHVDVAVDGAIIEDVIPVISGDQGAAWNYAAVDLSAWTGKVISIRFRGITGAGFTSDIALDDFSVGATLPVELLTFTGQLTENREVRLDWDLTGESGEEVFTIQRVEADGAKRDLLSLGSEGPSTSSRTYTSMDLRPMPGINTYQLLVSSPDGSVTRSNTVEVMVPLDAGLQVSEAYPNPFSGSTQIDVTVTREMRLHLRVYNGIGQEVMALQEENLSPGTRTLTIDAGDLPDGQYWLRVFTDGGEETRVLLKRD